MPPSSSFMRTAGGCFIRSSPGRPGLVTPADPTCTNLCPRTGGSKTDEDRHVRLRQGQKVSGPPTLNLQCTTTDKQGLLKQQSRQAQVEAGEAKYQAQMGPSTTALAQSASQISFSSTRRCGELAMLVPGAAGYPRQQRTWASSVPGADGLLHDSPDGVHAQLEGARLEVGVQGPIILKLAQHQLEATRERKKGAPQRGKA